MTGKAKETEKTAPTGLALLREPFLPNQISKLPKPTKFQTEEVRKDFKNGIRCEVCGAWHHPKVVHLDYVGHAALTDRLLDCDLKWNWEPVATNNDGTPAFDPLGGMWIRLTVCDVTRLGYGFPDGKTGGNAIKETIGDALRNAAMRFGAALDLWHKGDLHAISEDDGGGKPKAEAAGTSETDIIDAITTMQNMQEIHTLQTFWAGLRRELQHEQRVIDAKEEQKMAIMERPE